MHFVADRCLTNRQWADWVSENTNDTVENHVRGCSCQNQLQVSLCRTQNFNSDNLVIVGICGSKGRAFEITVTVGDSIIVRLLNFDRWNTSAGDRTKQHKEHCRIETLHIHASRRGDRRCSGCCAIVVTHNLCVSQKSQHGSFLIVRTTQIQIGQANRHYVALMVHSAAKSVKRSVELQVLTDRRQSLVSHCLHVTLLELIHPIRNS